MSCVSCTWWVTEGGVWCEKLDGLSSVCGLTDMILKHLLQSSATNSCDKGILAPVALKMEEAGTECDAWHETGAVQLGTGHGVVIVSSPAALSPVKFEERVFFGGGDRGEQVRTYEVRWCVESFALPKWSTDQKVWEPLVYFMWGSDVI